MQETPQWLLKRAIDFKELVIRKGFSILLSGVTKYRIINREGGQGQNLKRTNTLSSALHIKNNRTTEDCCSKLLL